MRDIGWLPRSSETTPNAGSSSSVYFRRIGGSGYF